MENQLLLQVIEDGADEDRLETLSLGLRDDLLELPDVDGVKSLSHGEAPLGTRGVDVTTVGAVLVTATASIELVRNVVVVVRDWLARGQRGRVVELSIGDRSLKLQSASPEEQERLVERFLQ